MKTKRKKHKLSRKTIKVNKKKYTKKKRIHRFRGGELDDNIKQIVAQNIQDRSINYSKMLQVSCKNPDNCLALGPYDEKIKLFFEDFRNLNYIDNPHIKKIGNDSDNGFIIELPFKKDNYTAYTVLKCSKTETSDNLFYEYYVGKYFINNYIKKMPCFIETYDLYEFNSDLSYKLVEDNVELNTLSNVDIKSNIHRIDTTKNSFDLFNYSCFKNKLICILIQHFDKFTSFYQEYKTNPNSIKYDLFNILYQVYYGLCNLKDTYTHYDLHVGNVFLYRPFEGNTCILMRYHRNDKVFEFKSEYVVKIIDYGRNYFNNGEISTKEIIEKICEMPECKPNCGEDFGYSIIKGSTDEPLRDFYWIDPIKPNMSHDLKFANYIKDILIKWLKLDSFIYIEDFGTPENLKGNKTNKRNIRNIFNLLHSLEYYIPRFNLSSNWMKYQNWKVAATMDIYDDGRDYEFVVLPD
jgi:hypothetical protein